MNYSAEAQLSSKIKELEVALVCSSDDTRDMIKIQLQCYRDSLVMIRRQSIGGISISPHELGWIAKIGSTNFLIRRISTDNESGYECYIQHQSDSKYYKLISDKLFAEMTDATKFILDKYKEGIV